jgi:hypothetical protein
MEFWTSVMLEYSNFVSYRARMHSPRAGYCAISSSGDRDRFFISGVVFSVYFLLPAVHTVHTLYTAHCTYSPQDRQIFHRLSYCETIDRGRSTQADRDRGAAFQL